MTDAARQHVDNSGQSDNPSVESRVIEDDDIARTIAAWQSQGLTAAEAYVALTGRPIGWGAVRALMERVADPDPERTGFVAHYAAYGITPEDLRAMQTNHDSSGPAGHDWREEELRAMLMGEE